MPATKPITAEQQRLLEDAQRTKNWKRWGPYLAERQWGTVREDYSADEVVWNYFPHDHARSRVYRWGEDGLLGITDREGRLNFALALWNGRDPILKERLFGLNSLEGNHGEDVKECYFYLASTPTHSYMKALYKYPQAEFPYAQLVEENKRRTRQDTEFELEDTGVFDENRYFDVLVEYAKAGPDDILIRATITNRGPDAAPLHVLPTIWFRNTWSWGRSSETKPLLSILEDGCVRAEHPTLGEFHFMTGPGPDGKEPGLLFTENETNFAKLFGSENSSRFVKDAFHEYVVAGKREAVNSAQVGTKAATHYVMNLAAGQQIELRFRLCPTNHGDGALLGAEFDQIFKQRLAEHDEFYQERWPKKMAAEERKIALQAYGGLLWSKQFYYYVVKEWLEGDPTQPAPPPNRKRGRNHEWAHLYNRDVVSMPDKWEYPWYASWDLAFHMVALAGIDADFAKDQLVRFLREWYMHPNGQMPAYEFAFSDVNPPVHAWAAWRVYKITGGKGVRDRLFLASVFQKLLLNFTWWVNRKDPDGNNLFGGGFLGLDNIGIFDRSKPLPGGGSLRQADGTAWMAFYCGTMLSMALKLAEREPAYEDMASKFFEHFVGIADSMNCFGGTGLWDEQDGFYYDQLQIGDTRQPLRVRSCVGLIPLIAVENISEEAIANLHGFKKRLHWFLDNRQDLARHISYMKPAGANSHKIFLLAMPSRERLERVLRYMLDEKEFLSPYGIRSVSRIHGEHPFVLREDGKEYCVDYEPGEATSGLFGGNSNWRGPIWFPINYLVIEALERYYHFYGNDLKVECPVGSGHLLNLQEVARELQSRLGKLFALGENGRRPCHGTHQFLADDPAWRELALFHEYFHGETGQGLGASHQTGWTALVARCMEDLAKSRK